MVLVQIRLLPSYARLRFSPGFWSFTFAWCVDAGLALRWLRIERPSGQAVYAAPAAGGVSLLVAGVASAGARDPAPRVCAGCRRRAARASSDTNLNRADQPTARWRGEAIRATQDSARSDSRDKSPTRLAATTFSVVCRESMVPGTDDLVSNLAEPGLGSRTGVSWRRATGRNESVRRPRCARQQLTERGQHEQRRSRARRRSPQTLRPTRSRLDIQ